MYKNIYQVQQCGKSTPPHPSANADTFSFEGKALPPHPPESKALTHSHQVEEPSPTHPSFAPQNPPSHQREGNIQRKNSQKKETCPSPSCNQQGCGQSHGHKQNKRESKNLVEKLLPDSVYNPKTKKIFGFIGAEDLLIIALIFLLSESDEDDSSILILVLIYLLISDYIDLSGFL